MVDKTSIKRVGTTVQVQIETLILFKIYLAVDTIL